MSNIIEIQQKLLPDLLVVMKQRYEILQNIRFTQPVGRRALAVNVGLTERVLRSEIQLLKDQQLVNVHSSGMTLTDEGVQLVEQLYDAMREVIGLSKLERAVKQKLGIEHCIIVPGDSDETPWVKKEMGRACVQQMKKHLKEQSIVALTGGTTISAVSEMMTPDPVSKEVLFVPARGGLGENVENQANYITAKMAERANAKYRLLYVPDQVSEEAYVSLIEEPSIKEVLAYIRSCTMVIHGIGEAVAMATRRNTSVQDMLKIEERQAVAEAFGYYFNRNGEVIHRVKTIGLQLEDLSTVPYCIAVAGGSSKAAAIHAYMKQAQTAILITDEGAAKQLLKE